MKLRVTPREPIKDPVAFFCRAFELRIPGAVWTTDDLANKTRTLYISVGTMPKGSISLAKDYTYVWNSAWEGKTIKGKWTLSSDKQTVTILKAQSGKDWKLTASNYVEDKFEIYLSDGSGIWYEGRALPKRTPKKK